MTSVDLVYLEPSFNSAQNYHAFFHEKDGTDAASQIHALAHPNPTKSNRIKPNHISSAKLHYEMSCM
jgi:hypothetical protein